MKGFTIKVISITFALALVLNAMAIQLPHTEDPPMHGTNTITQTYIS